MLVKELLPQDYKEILAGVPPTCAEHVWCSCICDDFIVLKNGCFECISLSNVIFNIDSFSFINQPYQNLSNTRIYGICFVRNRFVCIDDSGTIHTDLIFQKDALPLLKKNTFYFFTEKDNKFEYVISTGRTFKFIKIEEALRKRFPYTGATRYRNITLLTFL